MDVYDVVTLGETTIDAFLTLKDEHRHLFTDEKTGEICFRQGDKIPVEKYEFLLGGNAANIAVGLSRFGFKTAIFAQTGDDEMSEKIIRGLRKENVQTSLIVKTSGNASFSVVINFAKDRTIFVRDIKREHNFSLEGTKTKWLYLTSLGENWREAYEKAELFVKRSNASLAFNPGTPQIDEGEKYIDGILKQTDILFVNKEEGIKISNFNSMSFSDNDKKTKGEKIKRLLEELKRLGPKTVVVTDGANGSYIIDEKKEIFSSGVADVNVVEKTGAGDAYASGFLGAILAGKGIKAAMDWGRKNAASVIQKVGAQAGLLTREEMESL